MEWVVRGLRLISERGKELWYVSTALFKYGWGYERSNMKKGKLKRDETHKRLNSVIAFLT